MNKRKRKADYTILIFALAVFLFHSPLNIWWSSTARAWYIIFIPWLLIIGLLAWNQFRQDHGD